MSIAQNDRVPPEQPRLETRGIEFEEQLALAGRVRPGEELVWDEEKKTWLTGSYEVFREMTTQPDVFQFPGAEAEFAPPWLDRDFYVWYEGGPKKFNFIQGEEHDRLHRWWMKQFSPRRVAEWRDDVIRPHIDGLVDAFIGDGRAELMGQFARLVPLPIILGLMDIPVNDDLIERYNQVSHAFGHLRWRMLTETEMPDELRHEATQVSQQMRDILMPIVRERSSGEGHDLISRLWAATDELIEGDCDDEAVYANVTTLFEAGIGTGAAAIGEVVYVLCKSPGHQELLREDSSLITNYVEEALRLTTPALYIPRQVTKDIEFRGCPLHRGDSIAAVSLAAGRDDAHYANPDVMDLHRDAPRDHVAFGFGPRSCAGHAVGRAELQEVVAAFVTRLPNLRLDPGYGRPRRGGAGPRRPWEALHVVFGDDDV
jgi:cytochrome P450